MDFSARFYEVVRLDGDYAYLKLIDEYASDEKQQGEMAEEKCVARALLPAELQEGSRLKYEMMSYEMMN